MASAAERQSRDTRVRDGPGGRDETVGHRLVIELTEQAAAGHVGGARHRIDTDPAEARQVDLHAAVAGGSARVAVTAALDGQQQLALACEVDRRTDVRGTGRLHDERGIAIDRAVEHAARFVVARLTAQEERTAQPRLQLLQRRLFEADR